jgi:hypothetical protein
MWSGAGAEAMTLYKAPICKGCTHYHGITIVPNAEWNTSSCDAFPAENGIPVEIDKSEADHRKPYPGDNGIYYQPKDAEAMLYAIRLFTRWDEDDDAGDTSS